MCGSNERQLCLRAALDDIIDGGAVEYHESVSSTQLRAHELAREGVKKAVVAANEQTAARGRATRRWEAPKGGGIYISILYRPTLSSAHLMNAAAALSAAEDIKSSLGVETRLKWPNDLLIEKKREGRELKVCGILSESATRNGALDYCVTGIGINLYEPPSLPPDVAERAGWLCHEGKADEMKLLIRVVKNFFAWLHVMEREGATRVLGAYRRKCASIGRAVRVETDEEVLTGHCSGIGDDGELILETPGGTRCFHVGDVTHAKLG